MAPKTPSELKEQVERQNEKPARESYERTAEGMSVPTPKRKDFLANLEKVSQPEREDDEGAEAPS